MYRIKNFSSLVIICLAFVVCLTGCAGPSSYFRQEPTSEKTYIKVAIIPFTNLTTQRDADKKVTYALITYLLQSNYFDVIEAGEVQKAMKGAKVRKDEDLSFENIMKMGELTGVDVLLLGAVEEYKIDSSTMLGEKVFVPEISISARLISTENASILWAANHHRRGDDRVMVFGIGRIDSVSELTSIVVRDTVKSLVRAVRKKRDAFSMLKTERLSKKDKIAVSEKNSETEYAVNAPAGKVVKTTAMKAAVKKVKKKPVLPAKPKDPRQEVKNNFKKEYEKIKKQY